MSITSEIEITLLRSGQMSTTARTESIRAAMWDRMVILSARGRPLAKSELVLLDFNTLADLRRLTDGKDCMNSPKYKALQRNTS